MRYAPDNAGELVVVDSARRRFFLVKPVPTVADTTRAAFLAAIVQHVRWRLVKDGGADPGAFVVGSPDVNGWIAVP